MTGPAAHPSAPRRNGGDPDHLRRVIARAKKRRGGSAAPRPPTPGERLADAVATLVGSWRFILVQSCMLVGWIIGNALAGGAAWDPFPFILLNLMLSFQAAYTAPIIMMSQNRQSDVDRARALADYQVNLRAEADITLLHEKLDLLRERQLAEVTVMLKHALERLERLEERRT